ncbi:hypothetical protein VE01_05154 [Pseudogymnoascus verrucosus]|uniref:Major facilitator superfamily (MFS) profile domain-containing protein n=1 Tax=Pseudogymnoascus verrucosus TaxID=342668 RepID=A0A1B8GHU8_9PEZI|nr:uncharacterized protein VE01_05154 [Pseudogymnoascus verrucosus]OBT95422.1 hypothetical protein VE01_05154 [Pseudogymnoascus verrucosus]
MKEATSKENEKANNANTEVGEPPQGIVQDTAEITAAPETKYLTGLPLHLLGLALMASIFMIALDLSIITTAIPKITTRFNSLGDVVTGWYGSAYLLTQMAFQPSFGKIYTYFDLKLTFLTSIAIFEVGSVVCAAAPSSMAFIIGRAVAGFGAAGIFCGGLVIVANTVHMRLRPLFVGIVTSMYGVASVLGPTLGGLMTDSPRLTWRFCFWVNLPFGAIAVAIVTFVFKPTTVVKTGLSIQQKLAKSGIAHVVILLADLTCLVLALQWGGSVYPWSNSRVWGLLLGFGLLTILFIGLQIRGKEEALIPPRIVTQRSVSICCLYVSFMQLAILALSYFLPFFFQAVQGSSAKTSGLSILPFGITTAIATLISSAIVTLSGIYIPFMWLGAALLAVGTGLLHTLHRSSLMREWFGYQVISGIGFGIGVQIPFFAIQVVLDAADIPVAGALIAFCQSLGGTIGAAVAQNVFQSSLVGNLNKIPGIDVNRVVSAGGVGVVDVVPAPLLGGVRDAYNVAISSAFLVAVASAGVCFVASLGMEWRTIPRTKKKTDESTTTVMAS